MTYKTDVPRSCATCGKEFMARAEYVKRGKARYCSRKCWYPVSSSSRMIRKTVTCQRCGKEFMQRGTTQKYCGLKCGMGARKTAAPRSCFNCGKEYNPSPSRRLKFCSWECHREAQKKKHPTAKCVGCGVKFQRKYACVTRRARFCTAQCAIDHPKQKKLRQLFGGPTSRGRGWDAISLACRKRDKRCQGACDGKKRRLCADHIVPYHLAKDYTTLDPNDMANLMTMCEVCHTRKTGIERRLFKGDIVGFIAGARPIYKDIMPVLVALSRYDLIAPSVIEAEVHRIGKLGTQYERRGEREAAI